MAGAKEVPELPWPNDLMTSNEIAAFLKINRLVVRALCVLHEIPVRWVATANMLNRDGQALLRDAYLKFLAKRATLRTERRSASEPGKGWKSTGQFCVDTKISFELAEILCTVHLIPRIQCYNAKYLDAPSQRRCREALSAYVRATAKARKAKAAQRRAAAAVRSAAPAAG